MFADDNLTLTATRWQLAPELQRSPLFGGVLLVKNIATGTYLEVTRKQWQLLENFYEPHTVPPVLQEIIQNRTCPALGEFYELILKAVRAHILVEPQRNLERRSVVNWPLSVRPAVVSPFLWGMLLLGMGALLFRTPHIPTGVLDLLAGLVGWLIAAFAGMAIAASTLRGGGGEVYGSRGVFLRMRDARMLSPADQRSVTVAWLSPVAFVAGALALYRPTWSFLPTIGLLVHLRPFLKGMVPRLIRVSGAKRLSDAQQNYIFQPNRTARRRLELVGQALRNSATWLQLGYGIGWTLAATYLLGATTATPPWKLAFWETQGPLLGLTVAGSLGLLALVYFGSEFYLFIRNRAIARRNTLRQWYQRWLGRGRLAVDDAARMRVVVRSPLLRTLGPDAQLAIAHALKPVSIGAWRILQNFDQPVSKVSLIRSGKVGVYRRLPTGRRELVQVLCENDIVGLHAIADPTRPVFLYRTLTPVVLLQLETGQANRLILDQLGPVDISNPVQKLPFLSRLSLCENWHMQAVQRFVDLSKLHTYRDGEVILRQNFYSESFFIVFEGEARIVNSKGMQVGLLRTGNFFGEIGLLQNSNATATVIAGHGARCLCIPRMEFLRFVAHNYTVALTLERVSTKRLGRPIFPMVQGDFEQI